MGFFKRSDDHLWAQQHLSHYVEGDLSQRARRRLAGHAEDCPDCSRGILAMRALVRLIPGLEGGSAFAAPESLFARVRAARAGERASADTQRER